MTGLVLAVDFLSSFFFVFGAIEFLDLKREFIRW